jgi:iron complex transport system substrate-binding protein
MWAGVVSAQTTVMDAEGQPVVIRDTSRLVSVGGPVTEIIYALGAATQLVGVDTSSTYPESAQKLPQVGYQRTLSAEGVLSLSPSLMLASAEAGPPAALTQLRAAGVTVLVVPSVYSIDGVQTKIRLIARALGREAQGERLLAALASDLAAASAVPRHRSAPPRVLFIYARGAGTLNVAGADTSAAAMIALAGGRNAVTGYTGYKPLTAEAVVAAAPEVILIPARGLESVGGIDGLLKLPGLALTPAGSTRRVIAMDDLYLLGFGPRTGQAVRELTSQLYDVLPGSVP